MIKNAIDNWYIICVNYDVEQLSKIIENFYTMSKIDKTLSILSEIRNGKYYSASKIRNYLIGCYKAIVISLSIEEYKILKEFIISNLCALIDERNDRKIAYSLLSQIIEYSCYYNDFDVYHFYEKQILILASSNKEKYLYHIITMAQTRKKILGSIETIEDFFIKKYLTISRIKSINYKYLIDFTMNVDGVDKRKFLRYLFNSKPFRNDFIINSFILQHDELKKLGTLI